MSNSDIWISRFFFVAGIGYSGIILYKKGSFSHLIRGLQDLFLNGEPVSEGENANSTYTTEDLFLNCDAVMEGEKANSTDTELKDPAEGQAENANSTDTKDARRKRFRHKSRKPRPMRLREILRDDSDHMPHSCEHFVHNAIEKPKKIRKALQDDKEHKGNSYEYFVHNFIEMPMQIREALLDDRSKDYADILKAWKPTERL